MKILFLSARFWPHIGGVETHVYEVATRLAQEGHFMTIIAESSDKKIGYVKHNNLNIYYFHAGKSDFWKKFRIWRELFKLHKQFFEADLVHCHDVFFWYVPYLFLYFFKRVYITFHGYEGIFPPSRKAILIRRMSRLLSSGTMNVGHYIEKWYGTKPEAVIYGGVHNAAVTLSKIPKQINPHPHIVFVGRLAPDIGAKTYLELFKKLQPLTLDIYGDGPIRWKYQKYGKVHGFVPELDKFIRKADIVCASSYLTILQALSYGKPVIAVYENALKKDYLTLAPFAMWITISNSPTELARIISNSEFSILNKNLRKSLKEYLESHTWNEVVNSYEKLWKV